MVKFLCLKGDDDVTVCKFGKGVSTIEHYYNEGKWPILLDQTQPSVGYSNMKIQTNSSILQCSFRRSKFVPNQDKYFDLSESYYLLVAYGELNLFGICFNHE